MDLVYLDNNATTQPAAEVVAGMLPYLSEVYGNPSSVHRFGQRARRAIDEARGQVARLLGGAESELLFTGGGTESINSAIRGLLAMRAGRKRVVTSSVEHSASRELCRRLAKEGLEIDEIPVDHEGGLDLDRLKAAVTDEVALVSIMWANNETGVIFPVEQIAEICKAAHVPFHCDATQAVGKVPTDFGTVGMSVASLAGHKFHGPKGVGAMYIRRGTRLAPLLIGGPQERGRRGGTENVAGIVGMGVAAELAGQHLPEMSRVAAQRDRLEQGILQTIPDTHVIGGPGPAPSPGAPGEGRGAGTGKDEGRRMKDEGNAEASSFILHPSSFLARVPNTTNIGFARLEAEAILLLLSEQNICASAGAACSSGSLEPSHVLLAMGIDPKIAHGAIRFSLSRYTADSEIDRALEVLPKVISRLRAVLPVGA